MTGSSDSRENRIRELEKDIKSRYAGVRNRALAELNSLIPEYASDYAYRRLHSKAASTRWLAFQIICDKGKPSGRIDNENFRASLTKVIQSAPKRTQLALKMLLSSSHKENQVIGLHLAHEIGDKATTANLHPLIQSVVSDPAIVLEAPIAAVNLAPERWPEVAKELLSRDESHYHASAVEIISKYADRSWVNLLINHWFDGGEAGVAAHKALSRFYPKLCGLLRFNVDTIFDKLWFLPRFKLRECPPVLFEMVATPGRFEPIMPACLPDKALDAIRSFPQGAIDLSLAEALESTSGETRNAALITIRELSAVSWLDKALEKLNDRSEVVREEALKTVVAFAPEMAHEKAIHALSDGQWGVVRTALDLLRELPSGKGSLPGADREAVISTLVKWSHGTESLALNYLADWDDPRVMSVLVNALNSDDQGHAITARNLLKKTGSSRLPVLRNYPRRHWGETPWTILQEQCSNLRDWARTTGEQLLDVPVKLEWYYDGIGETRARQQSSNKIDIRATNLPIFSEIDTNSYHGQERGEEVVKGIILHEIGHHLYDDGEKGHWTVRGQAQAEGLDEIYAILRDDRLERRLAARKREWARYLDRLNAYAFSGDKSRIPLNQLAAFLELPPETVRKKFITGELDGVIVEDATVPENVTVEVSNSFLLSIPGALPPLYAFLLGLKAGLHVDEKAYPDVVKALALIPGNFKELTHGGLLKLSRAIGDIIGREKVHRKSMKAFDELLKNFRELLSQLEAMMKRLESISGSFADLKRQLNQGSEGENSSPLKSSSIEDNRERSEKEASHQRRSAEKASNSDNTGMSKLRDPESSHHDSGQFKNLGKECGFDRLAYEMTLQPDKHGNTELLQTLRLHIRRLRPYLERLGTRSEDQYASRRGRRIDIAQVRQAVFRPTPNLLVFSEETQQADAYLGILIDKSGSMSGEKMRRAHLFATLLAESTRGIRGLTGHVNAFDNDTFYRLGTFQRNAITALSAGGANNDAGGLFRATELAIQSGKRHKLLIMISDGTPTACTFESLKKLVEKVTSEHGILCAQVAVAPISEVAFPHFVDFSQMDTEEAITQFGRLLRRLTAQWY